MDPDATYRIMTALDSDLEERAVAAVDLLVWMASAESTALNVGGRVQWTWDIADECKHHIFRALDRLSHLEGTS